MAIDWKKFIEQHHIKNLPLQEQIKLFKWENAYSEKPHQQQLKEDFTNASTSTPGRTGRGGSGAVPPPALIVNYLVVAGGGASMGGASQAVGGSGAGGLRTSFGTTSGGGASAESSLCKQWK